MAVLLFHCFALTSMCDYCWICEPNRQKSQFARGQCDCVDIAVEFNLVELIKIPTMLTPASLA